MLMIAKRIPRLKRTGNSAQLAREKWVAKTASRKPAVDFPGTLGLLPVVERMNSGEGTAEPQKPANLG